MSYHATITADEIRRNLDERLAEQTAKLTALQGVTINTKHKTLTNRAVTGEGARIGDYLGINKALYVSYRFNFGQYNKYERVELNAYSYTTPDGSEIGSNGGLRTSRTLTPAELQVELQKLIDGVVTNIAELKAERRSAETIARKHNKLVADLKQFNDGLSYASKAQI